MSSPITERIIYARLWATKKDLRSSVIFRSHTHIKAEDTAAERAVNVKAYLVTGKGIDAARVTVATGKANGRTAEDYLVPSGASFAADVPATTLVDETAVGAQTRKPLAAAAHKKPVSAATQKPAQPAE